MASPQRLSDLARRKHLLLAHAELHRQMLSLEVSQLTNRALGAGRFAARHRWWLLGGAATVGIVIARRGRTLATWLPALLSVTRAFTR